MRSDVLLALQKSLELARNGQSDPGAAVRNSPLIAQLLGSALPVLAADDPATRVIFPESFPSVTISNAGAITDTAEIVVEFPRSGLLKGLVATVAEGHSLGSLVSMRLRIPDEAPIFGNKTTVSPVPLSLITGPDSRKGYIFPIERRVESTTRWYLTFTSQTKQYPATTLQYTPIVGFVIAEDRIG